MAVRYSDARLQIAARAKFKCLESLRVAVAKRDPFDLSWNDMCLESPEASKLTDVAKGAGLGIKNLLCPPAPRGGDEPTFNRKPSEFKPPSVDADSSSDSSSSSSEATSAQEVVGTLLDKYHDLEWVVSNQVRARIHIVKSSLPVNIVGACGKKSKPTCLTEYCLRALALRGQAMCDMCLKMPSTICKSLPTDMSFAK